MWLFKSESDLDIVVGWSKKFEDILENDFHAHGRGLHEKLNHVSPPLPDKLVKKLRYIATIRNKIVHNADCNKLEDRTKFNTTCEQALQELEQEKSNRRSWCTVM